MRTQQVCRTSDAKSCIQAIQRWSPVLHTIVEAHQDVLERMRQRGWMDRPGVRVLAGRWQDVLPPLLGGSLADFSLSHIHFFPVFVVCSST